MRLLRTLLRSFREMRLNAGSSYVSVEWLKEHAASSGKIGVPDQGCWDWDKFRNDCERLS